MNDFDQHLMGKVVAFVGDADEQSRRELRRILNQAGIKQVAAHGNLDNLTQMMGSVTPDMIIVASDLAPNVFDFVRDIRHNKIGSNPFVVIIMLLAADQVSQVEQAMETGTDDLIIKPLKEDQILQRLKRVMMNRAVFVVTSDYVGPDRRGKNRPSNIRRIAVPNTMLEKASGRDVDEESIRASVDACMSEVLAARLDSHGLRMGFVCNLILETYKSGNISPDTQDKLKVLVGVLRDAAKTAERLGETQLALLCGSLSADVGAIAERYTAPTDRDIGILQKLSTAVVSAVKPRATPDKLAEENRQAAETYQQRQRSEFHEAQEIRRTAGEEPVVTFDEPVIEILPLAKGQFLFKQGDPATAAYILNSGLIGIFKEVDGKRQPIARVKKGEFFGEMAIIDGRPRRNSAMALEDCTLSLVSKEMIEEKLQGSDTLIRTLLHMLTNSLRAVHETYAPKGRNIADAVRDMKDQARHIQTHIAAGSPGIQKDGAGPAKKLNDVTDAIVKLVESAPELDRRTPAVPSEKDLAG